MLVPFALGAALLAQGSAQPTAARPRPTAQAVRFDTAPVIDGRLDDAVWSGAVPIGAFTQVEPVEGAPPSERTEVRIGYDAGHLYIGVRCFDSDVQGIVGTQMERDARLDPDDRVEIVIDTFLDRRNAYFFQMNPVGSKGDALVTDNGRDFNKPWDGIWEGRSSIDDAGWSMELALPFETLNFRPGLATWGLNLNRYIKRHEELARWASPFQNMGIFRISEAGDLVGLADLEQGIGLDVKPFFVADASRVRSQDDTTVTGSPGFDLVYKVTPGLNALFTVNTDFAETEVDSRQVNLTRFPLFFPEKRDFFLQDAGQFGFADLDSGLVPFFSRRIGLDPATGEEIPIEWGAKVTGRAGPWNIGVLDVETGAEGDIDPTNLFVARLKRNVGASSTVGGIVTSGDPTGGEDSWLAGLDANYRTTRAFGDQNLTANLWGLASDTQGLGQDHAFGASLGFPNDLVAGELSAREIGEDFDAKLGFVPRTGIRRYAGELALQPRPDGGAVRQLEFAVAGELVTDLSDRVESGAFEVQPLGVIWDSGDSLRASVETLREDLEADFDIRPDVTIPSGSYSFERVALTFASSEKRPLSADVGLSFGGFYDGSRTDWIGFLAWRASRFLTTGLELEHNDVDLDDGDFRTLVARLRTLVSFTPDISWSTFLQHDNESDTFGVNSRLRWILSPGRELLVVVNETLEHEDGSTSPELQQAIVKLELTFRF